MFQKCPKNVPKMYQKCSKNGQEMVKKWSTAHQLRQGANRLPPTIRCLGLLRFWLEKIIFFHLREQIFFLERQITGNTPEFDALSIPHTHRTGTFFYDRVPTRFRFLRRKKKEERKKEERTQTGKMASHGFFFLLMCVFAIVDLKPFRSEGTLHLAPNF